MKRKARFRLDTLPESKGHTPIYKQHRYFARRPHNQFRSLIEAATAAGDIVLDCMGGGGATLVEGLTVGRRVISVDINPLAAFVQAAQVAEYDPEVVARVYAEILDELPHDVKRWYTTVCRDCGGEARVRWYERVHVVSCPGCDDEVALASDGRAVNPDGRIARGKYNCTSCGLTFSAAVTPRIRSQLLRARVKCACGCQETRPVTEAEVRLAEEISEQEPSLAAEYGLDIPYDTIPLHWDRQFEDGLAGKGFQRFADLFTSRNRTLMAFLLRGVKTRRSALDQETYLGVLIVASALIRYVNNMTVSVPGWMDGRPAAWAKHAYWTPNEFVECNPFEYLEHRLKAIRAAATDREKRFANLVRGDHASAVITGEADYCVLRADARRLDIPAGVIDAVVTDPPFGSNVQYGELTALWLVWLRGLIPYECDDFMQDEILVTRRRKVAQKTFEEYENGLTAVFRECYRVLKREGVLIFTFNNRDPRAWQAVMRAAFSAGFSLGIDDLAYQDEIHAYRDTAHLRFGDELQGDVVYAFRKDAAVALLATPPVADWREEAERRLAPLSGAELQRERIALHLESLAFAAAAIQQGLEDEAAERVSASLQVVSAAGKDR